MTFSQYANQDPIMARATAPGRSALAIIRISGAGCVERFAPLFSANRKLVQGKGHTLHYGKILSNKRSEEGKREVIDEVIVALYRAPKSFTGEESLEINCHGGEAVVRRLLLLLEEQGFRQARPGEFTYRALHNNRVSIERAQTIQDLCDAFSEAERKSAISRLEGALSTQIDRIRELLVRELARVEAALDYDEEEIQDELARYGDLSASLSPIREEIGNILKSYALDRRLRSGFTVVLAGGVNSGKSSLFNRLLRQDAAITSPLPGTTRDSLHAEVLLNDYRVNLYDTAGFRKAAISDAVEAEGIRRAEELLVNSDLVLYLVDGSAGLSGFDHRYLKQIEKQKLWIVQSKHDLGKSKLSPQINRQISVVSGEGIPELIEDVTSLIGGISNFCVESSFDNQAEVELLRESAARLATIIDNPSLPIDVVASELKAAVSALDAFISTGMTDSLSDELLERVFRDFCVGK